MNDKQSRFSILRPLTVDEGVKLLDCILTYFSPLENTKIRRALDLPLNDGMLMPLPSFELMKYITICHPEINALQYMHHIRSLIERLEAKGILVNMGASGNVIIPKNYHSLMELTKKQELSHYWFADHLGGEFIYDYFNDFTVRIIGENEAGDEHAGTGVILSNNVVLTCAHVLNEMKPNNEQVFQGQNAKIKETRCHPKIDVGVIVLEGSPLRFDNSVCFRTPQISDEIYLLGYPPIPYTQNPSPVMQKGEVINASVKSYEHNDLFLFSAIARPGNSGGPIIARTGEIIGLVTSELSYQESTNFPFFAGVPSASIASALAELGFENVLPIEDYQ